MLRNRLLFIYFTLGLINKMNKYRVTKYDPKNRNKEGHYMYDHWTELGDVGKTLEGELVTPDAYLVDP